MTRLAHFLPALALGLWCAGAATQEAPPLTLTLPTVEVVATTPLLGSGVDAAKVPAETQVLTGADVTREGNADALRALNQNVPGVTLDAAAGNPFQPSLFYHGFQASPLQGNPQGLAVYLNGARFNQPFGDTVNWDLIPDLAIDRMNLVGSNPVFGLNALGGALSVQMKNGFTYQGTELDALGGSFGKYEGELQYGVQKDGVAAYVAASGVSEGGWRDLQSSDLANFYADLGWRGNRGEVHLNAIYADDRLNGPGTTPVQLLAVDPSAQFTAPNLITNNYTQVNLNGSYQISDKISLQGNAYYEYFLQKIYNANVPSWAPCPSPEAGFLCEMPGVFLTGRNGEPIPSFNDGGFYSELDQQSTNTNGYGAALQLTDRHDLCGRPNHFVVGASFDGAQTLFGASAQAGSLSVLDRVFAGPGITIDQPDGSIAPVRVAISNAYWGAFFTDTYDFTPRLTGNVSGRFNFEEIDLADQIGSSLTGNHSYSRFNPAGGLTYKLLPDLSVYASYADANRAPTPAELTCANPTAPCSLANFFTGDPSLQQVVSHTFEAGVRSRLHPFAGATLSSDIAYYHASLANDILFVNSPIIGRAFFENVGSTLRQGVDVNLRLEAGRLHAFIGYAYIDASFQSGFTAASPLNPGANAAGNIRVRPGNRLPGIPANRLKIGFDYRVTEAWTVGGTGIYAAGQFLLGDEANLNPPTPPYFVLNLYTNYRLTKHLQLFGQVENAFNATYYTFGTFSPTSLVPIVQAPGATNPRSLSPAPADRRLCRPARHVLRPIHPALRGGARANASAIAR
jgi:outer membrane receptor protein involved in Fe transport